MFALIGWGLCLVAVFGWIWSIRIRERRETDLAQGYVRSSKRLVGTVDELREENRKLRIELARRCAQDLCGVLVNKD